MRRARLARSCLMAAAVASGLVGGSGTEPVAAQEPPTALAAAEDLTRESGSLPFFWDLYTFRGQGDATRVVAAYAVPAERLREEDDRSSVRYRFDVTLVLVDTALHSVSRTDDSVFVRVPDALDDEHLLHTHVEVDAPPSTSTVQRVLMFDATTPGVGQLYGAAFPIPDYSGDTLMLSDIVLGLPEGRGGWKRGKVTLAVLPTSQFPQSSFDVYYEVYNLPTGHRYATDVSVERVDEEGAVTDERAVHTRFTEEAVADADDSVAELRRVSASLDEGRYRLTVRVTDETTGEVAARSRDFQVRGWGPGITMVPALPAGREVPSGS